MDMRYVLISSIKNHAHNFIRLGLEWLCNYPSISGLSGAALNWHFLSYYGVYVPKVINVWSHSLWIRVWWNQLALSSYLLPRLIGYSRANALFLSGDVFYPSSPIISDLFFQILENREDVLPAALKFAHRLASTTSATSVAITKALIWHGKDTVEEQHLLESRAIKYTTGSKDAEEGAVSFLEKRKPDFKATLSSDLPSWVPWVCIILVFCNACWLIFTFLVGRNRCWPWKGEAVMDTN